MRHEEWLICGFFVVFLHPTFTPAPQPSDYWLISVGDWSMLCVLGCGAIRSRVYSVGGCPPGSPDGTPSAPLALRSWRHFWGKSSNTSILPGRVFANVWTQLRNQTHIKALRSWTHAPCRLVGRLVATWCCYGETFTLTEANRHFKLYKTINNLRLI
jgi:hypothetical protein